MEIPEEAPEIPDIQADTTSKNKYIIPILAAVIIIGAGIWFTTGIHLGGGNASTASKEGAQTDNSQGYIDFAENVAITLRNLSYFNLEQHQEDLSKILSDTELSSYQKYYNDTGFVNLITTKKLSCNFQKIEHSTLVKRVGNVAAVRVIGYCNYYSDLSKSSAEYPFTFMVQVEQKDGNYICTKLERE